MKNTILIVASNYYQDILNNLIIGSTDFLKINKFDFEIIYAPGCFEIPFLIKENINDYLAFISLGCIIKGETYHFEVIANECARKIMDLSVDFNKPIGFGILTCKTHEQAIIRSDPLKKNKGKEVAKACVELLNNNYKI